MTYPLIDPVLIHLGPLQIRWYGLMYVIGFFVAYLLLLRVSRYERVDMERHEMEDVLTWCIVGLIVGARLGYCLIYNLGVYLANPLKLLAVWEGGMSFHGGMLGVLLAGWLFARRRNKSFLMLADLGAVVATPGLFFGRMGNFINAELYGRITEMPWGMVFPGGGPFARHPSQLYEAVFEGLVLFMILYRVHARACIHGVVIALFLMLYGTMRFIIEFFRQPDPQMGFVAGVFTMGQVLCGLMFVAGAVLLYWRLKSLRHAGDNEVR